jgi:hypothetical protein
MCRAQDNARRLERAAERDAELAAPVAEDHSQTRLGVAVAGQVLDLEADQRPLEDGQRAVVVEPGGSVGQAGWRRSHDIAVAAPYRVVWVGHAQLRGLGAWRDGDRRHAPGEAPSLRVKTRLNAAPLS